MNYDIMQNYLRWKIFHVMKYYFMVLFLDWLDCLVKNIHNICTSSSTNFKRKKISCFELNFGILYQEKWSMNMNKIVRKNIKKKFYE